jgi:hypothetical protein
MNVSSQSETPDALERPAIALPKAADLPEGRRLAGLFSVLVSLALLIMVLGHFERMSFSEIWRMIPASPPFWIAFVAWYLAIPASEWLIYNRLWKLPPAAIGALLRKLVSNELLLGYLGEAQFYAWARSKVAMTATPFGAIKDTAIISALVGNVVTLALLWPAWKMLGSIELSSHLPMVFKSLAVVLASSFAILLFRRQLFSLPRRDLRFIAAMQLARTGAQIILGALMWHWVLPDVPIATWFVLSTLRMLVSRLPLVPNKDVLFATIAIYVIGHDARIDDLMTLMAGLILAAHILVGLGCGIAGLFEQVGDRAARTGEGQS